MTDTNAGGLERSPTETGQIANQTDGARFEPTAFQFDLLAAIARSGERPCGQDIKGILDEQYGRDLSHNRLYPNLDTLAAKELVEKGQINRRANYYALTDEGTRLLESRMDHLVGAVREAMDDQSIVPDGAPVEGA